MNHGSWTFLAARDTVGEQVRDVHPIVVPSSPGRVRRSPGCRPGCHLCQVAAPLKLEGLLDDVGTTPLGNPRNSKSGCHQMRWLRVVALASSSWNSRLCQPDEEHLLLRAWGDRSSKLSSSMKRLGMSWALRGGLLILVDHHDRSLCSVLGDRVHNEAVEDIREVMASRKRCHPRGIPARTTAVRVPDKSLHFPVSLDACAVAGRIPHMTGSAGMLLRESFHGRPLRHLQPRPPGSHHALPGSPLPAAP